MVVIFIGNPWCFCMYGVDCVFYDCGLAGFDVLKMQNKITAFIFESVSKKTTLPSKPNLGGRG